MRSGAQLAIFLLLIGRSFALACSCVQALPSCSSFRAPTDANTAIFVGVVKEVYPTETIPNLSLVALDEWKGVLLRVWTSVLSAREEQRIREAKSLDDIILPLNGTSWPMPRRVRLEIIERFTGPTHETFELFTGNGDGDCGVPFETGKTYYVVSSRDVASGRWSTGVCAGSRLLEPDGSDLAVLRAWKKGLPIPRSAWGTIWDSGRPNQSLAGLEVQFKSGRNAFYTATDDSGNFLFKNLPAGVYIINVLPPGRRLATALEKRVVDLTSNVECAGLRLSVEQMAAP
jgi:hypothetical protein